MKIRIGIDPKCINASVELEKNAKMKDLFKFKSIEVHRSNY